jgi:hypothetical protein
MKDPVHVIGVVLLVIILLVGVVSGVQQCSGG